MLDELSTTRKSIRYAERADWNLDFIVRKIHTRIGRRICKLHFLNRRELSFFRIYLNNAVEDFSLR